LALNNGFKVIGLLRPETSKTVKNRSSGLSEYFNNNDVKFVEVDLRDTSQLQNVIKEFSPIYLAHLASQSSVRDSYNDKKNTYESNTVVSNNLINTIEKFSKETILFFPSSATIYEGYENTVVNELTQPKPKTVYSISKLETQNYIKEKIQTKNLNLNTGIMFSHESPYRSSKFFTKKIIEFLINYKENNNLSIKVGNLSIERDIGYAPEYVDAIFSILKNNRKEEYIVSSNTLTKLYNFLNICLDYLDINYEVVISDNNVSYINKDNNFEFITSTSDQFRVHDLIGIRGDNKKILEQLSWKPTKKLEQICEIMLDFELGKK
tara:strand:+ start:16006 stop:16971 length:966 start_codon:yes stop_codon:yes gene_type:complete